MVWKTLRNREPLFCSQKNMPYIAIGNIVKDCDDGSFEIEITVSNDAYMAKQILYLYPETLLNFGSQLQDFPKNKEHQVTLEFGQEPNFHCYFLLRTIFLNSACHSAWEVKVDNKREVPEKSSANFFMKAEPYTINDFGKQLCRWAKGMNSEFRFEWKFNSNY